MNITGNPEAFIFAQLLWSSMHRCLPGGAVVRRIWPSRLPAEHVSSVSTKHCYTHTDSSQMVPKSPLKSNVIYMQIAHRWCQILQ